MANLADVIQHYLSQMLTERETVEVQRRQLAHFFGCAPSQINYVLETRFTMDLGYIVESRRGGGGFIRITRLPEEGLAESLGGRISPSEVPALLAKLVRKGAVSRAEAYLLEQAMEDVMAGLDLEPGVIRARLLRAFLTLLSTRGR